MIISHSHPSGNPEPSQADKVLTGQPKEASALVEAHVLDHIVAGNAAVALAERGLL